MAILNNSNAISASGGYTVDNSLRFRSSASAYLNRTPASAGNRQIMTYSFWVKRGAITGDYNLTNASTDANNNATFYFNSSNNQSFDVFLKVSATNYSLTTSQVFRDPSAWYHIVVAIDTTQATSSNRTKVYVNGSQVTNFLTANYVPQNSNLALNNNVAQYIGYSNYFDGYLADINFIDGSAKTPSDFGETDTTTGVWKPKAYTGSYGTNGFYLKFSDIATTSGSNAGLGKDFSGNTNYWTTNNISVTSGTTYDAMIDSPTNASSGTRPVGNYATLNPLQKYSGLSASTNGNLTIAGNSANWRSILSTFATSSGKWYCEINMTSVSSDALTGIFNINSASDLYDLTTVDNRQLGRYAGGYGYQNNGNKVNNNTGTSYGSTYTTGDVIGIAFDLDNGKIWFSKNGTWQASGDPAAGTNAAYTGLSGLFSVGISTANGTFDANFGQRPFAYTPPTGYQALCTTNLPTPTILKGNQYMDATLYTGNGSTLAVTNAGSFKPDLVWVKCRSTARNHNLFDSNRGTTKRLNSNLTDVEDTASGVTSFDTGGFTLGSNTVANTSADTYVGWQWQAGQGTTSSNTSGSITSTVSVSTTAGFSVVTYTSQASGSATFGHGLGVAPSMIFLKGRNVAGGWYVYHSALGGTKYLALQSTGAATTAADGWNNTNPTSTLVTVGNGYAGSYNMVAYCFAAIPGYSAFGNYTGNGSADGPMVYLNFAPKFIMVKRTDTTGDWQVIDTSRQLYNNGAVANQLRPNSSVAEASAGTYNIDILSNGFKDRTGASTNWNTNGGTYIYMAFAENPFASNNRAR